MDNFIKQYVITALWSSYNDDGDSLDNAYSFEDLAPETLEEIQKDLKKFHLDNAELIDLAIEQGADLTNIAHDFWLTRNGHGAGFWDGDYSKELGEALSDAAHSFGEVNLYVGDDGKIYQR